MNSKRFEPDLLAERSVDLEASRRDVLMFGFADGVEHVGAVEDTQF